MRKLVLVLAVTLLAILSSGRLALSESDKNTLVTRDDSFRDLQPNELSDSVDPVAIGKAVYVVFENDPVKALKLITQMELYSRYDMTRVRDTSAHEAFYALRHKLNLNRVIKWGTRHPAEYRRVVRWAVAWAEKAPPPSYKPIWMVKHGLEYKGSESKIEESLVAEHVPEKAWNAEILELKKFHASSNWRRLEEEVKEENVKNTLVSIFDRSIRPYIQTKSGEQLSQIERDLQNIIARYDSLEGEPGDRIYHIEYMIEQYLFTKVGR